jgi:hypothetical protein
VLLTEYNAKHQRKLDQRDAREEGRIEGIELGLQTCILNMLIKNYNDEDICEIAGCNQEMIDRVRQSMEDSKIL